MRQGIKNFFFLAILCSLCVGCATVPITGRNQVSFVPQSQLISVSMNNYRQIMSESELSKDTVKVQMVKNVGARIAQATEDFMQQSGRGHEIRDFSWEFNLIQGDDQKNAFAMPGGKVFVYTGILPLTQNESGLATVIGHEIAHVIANHSGERMSQLLIVQLGGITLSQAMKDNSARAQQIANLAYGAGTTLGAILPYSRLHESEADRIGLILMAKAGYDPRAAIPFWQRMMTAGGAKVPELLSTHPSSKTRIKRLQELIPEALKYYRP